MKAVRAMGALAVFAGLALLSALAQNAPRSTSDSVRGHFASINRRVLDMAKDFPADKYDYSLKPEMRSTWSRHRSYRVGKCLRREGRTRRECELGRAGSQELQNEGGSYHAPREEHLRRERHLGDLARFVVCQERRALVERYGAFRRALWPSCGLLPRQRFGPTRFTADQTLIRHGSGVSRLPAWHGLRLTRLFVATGRAA